MVVVKTAQLLSGKLSQSIAHTRRDGRNAFSEHGEVADSKRGRSNMSRQCENDNNQNN
jgi:hypothetical protein